MRIKISPVRWACYALLLVGIFFSNTWHDSYPDEFDNILGGRYILEGKVIYRDFFTHHGPVAYWLAAITEILSGTSFVRFRVAYSFILLGLVLVGYFFIRRRFAQASKFYLIQMLLLGIAATYFWGHMLLADNLAAFFLLPVYALLTLSAFFNRKVTTRDWIAVSIFSALSLLSALTYVYLTMFIYLFSGYLYLKQNPLRLKALLGFISILVAPYIIFLVYLVATGSLGAYFDQSVFFNTRYYAYNLPRPEGSTSVNPIRIAITTTKRFYNNFSDLLINSKDFNFAYPFTAALAVSNAATILSLLLFRRLALTSFILSVLVFANARSDPLSSRETDYQSAVYIVTSLFNFSFIVPYLYNQLNEKAVEVGKKVVVGALFIVVLLYGFYNVLFLFRKFSDKTYDKYMGQAPLIYDRPVLAPIINKLVAKNEYMWIGPFEFEELFYAEGKLPSKYHILIPAMQKSVEIQREVLLDFENHKPKAIFFNQRQFIANRSAEEYASFFLAFLNSHYITLKDYSENGTKFVSAIPVSERVDLETKLYLDKERVPELVTTLLRDGFIRPK